MKLRLREIVLASASLDKLFGARPRNESVLFRMAQVRKPIIEVLQAHGESRLRLLKEYATESPENPGNYTFAKQGLPATPKGDPFEAQDVVIDLDALNSFRDEYEALLEEKVTVQFDPLELKTLSKLNMDEPLSPDEFIHVAFLFEEGKELCGTED